MVLGERTLGGDLRDLTVQGELLSLLGIGPVAAERALVEKNGPKGVAQTGERLGVENNDCLRAFRRNPWLPL